MSDYRERLCGVYKELNVFMYDFETINDDEEEEEEDEMMDDNSEEGDDGDGDDNDDDEMEDVQKSGDESNDEKIIVKNDDENEDEDEEDEETISKSSPKSKFKKTKPKPEILVALLSQIISIMREASLNASYTESFPDLIKHIDQMLSKAIVFAYNDDPYGPYCESHMPSFAHDDRELEGDQGEGGGGGKKRAPLLQDASELDSAYQFSGMMLPHIDSFMKMFAEFMDPDNPRPPPELKIPPAWKTTFRPHPFSTPCARFRDTFPDIDPSTSWGTDTTNIAQTHPTATAVLQARVEISSTNTSGPSSTSLSAPTGDTLALTHMGGYKNRVPYVTLYHPNNTAVPAISATGRGVQVKLDLTSGVHEMVLDEGEEDTLLFAGDWERIKSYRCAAPADLEGEDGVQKKSRRVHTLASKDFSGPIALLSLPLGSNDESGSGGKKILRVGKRGRIAVWDLDTLPTHGDDGQTIIGTRIAKDDFNTWRDDPESIEPSTGSEPTSFIQLQLDCNSESESEANHIQHKNKNKNDDLCEIGAWHAHPDPAQAHIMLCGSSERRGGMADQFFCYSFDLSRGGPPVVRYLGHGGAILGFSTSPGDTNVFLTRCADGHARLFDTRVVLPVLTIAGAGPQLEPLSAAVLAHADGIPFIFTSTARSECIKVWDVRAQASIYELATGNNYVEDMAWDAGTSTLFASTESTVEGGYRLAKIPRVRGHTGAVAGAGGVGVQAQAGTAANVQDEDDAEEDDDDEHEEEHEPPNNYKCWPKRAVHAENYFGHVFDAGSHRIFKYRFKPDPDSTILPRYGNATVRSGANDYW